MTCNCELLLPRGEYKGSDPAFHQITSVYLFAIAYIIAESRPNACAAHDVQNSEFIDCSFAAFSGHLCRVKELIKEDSQVRVYAITTELRA